MKMWRKNNRLSKFVTAKFVSNSLPTTTADGPPFEIPPSSLSCVSRKHTEIRGREIEAESRGSEGQEPGWWRGEVMENHQKAFNYHPPPCASTPVIFDRVTALSTPPLVLAYRGCLCKRGGH